MSCLSGEIRQFQLNKKGISRLSLECVSFTSKWACAPSQGRAEGLSFLLCPHWRPGRPTTHHNMDLDNGLSNLSKKEIMEAGQPVVFGLADRRSRAHLLETVALLPLGDRGRIYGVSERKRKANEGIDENCKQKRPKDSDTKPGVEAPMELQAADFPSEFFKVQPDSLVEECIARFIDRTGNDALAMETCVSCARELATSQMTLLSLDAIPNCHLLAPFEPHPAHELTGGLLLHTKAIIRKNGKLHGFVCAECMRNLGKKRTPRLALANGMWTGDVPFELSVLTIPEQILICKHFSAAYIVKMFPMRRGAKSVNSGLRGNISTYRLDTNEIADMVGDNIMPRQTKILASTIGVTIVGPKNIPEQSMPGFLHVRRERVQKALVWLAANNPFYANGVISDERLHAILEDGVPDKILEATRYSDDTEEVDRERAGYVPEDDDQSDGSDADKCALSYGNGAAGIFNNLHIS